MLYFNVIRNIIAEDMYYYFSRNGQAFYQGFQLPENANDFLIIEISGGECEHGEYLAFEVGN